MLLRTYTMRVCLQECVLHMYSLACLVDRDPRPEKCHGIMGKSWNHGKIMESWLHEAGAELRDPRHGASNVMWRGLRPREEKRWPRPCNSQPSGQVRTGRQAPRLPVPGPSHPPPAPVSVSPPYAWRMALQMQPPALASGLKAQPCEVHLQTGRLCL